MSAKSKRASGPFLLILRGATGAGKSSVGLAIARLRPAMRVIEIDDLKRAKYGSAATCVPAVDYPLAGAGARKLLDQGIDTIVIEPLWNRWHLRSVLTGAGLFLKSNNVIVVWLECSLAVAIERKRGRVDALTVAQHHQYVSSRDHVPKETVIDTEDHSVEEIAAMILRLLPDGNASGEPAQASSR